MCSRVRAVNQSLATMSDRCLYLLTSCGVISEDLQRTMEGYLSAFRYAFRYDDLNVSLCMYVCMYLCIFDAWYAEC